MGRYDVTSKKINHGCKVEVNEKAPLPYLKFDEKLNEIRVFTVELPYQSYKKYTCH